VSSAPAFAKINLTLVVGPLRDDGKHEVVTLMQRAELHDVVTVEPADALSVTGFPADTIVSASLEALALAADVAPRWHVLIEKRVPVAAGLGGGSSDAATALALANETLDDPLPHGDLLTLAATIGADVPFFLEEGSHIATGDGTNLARVDLPVDYAVALVVPHDTMKESTKSVYEAFDARGGASGFAERVAAVQHAVRVVADPRDLALLPRNDLASSPLAEELLAAGAFRADVTGAGPTVYGLFEDETRATEAAVALDSQGSTFVTRPVAALGRPRVAR
jgi:4-diphosphocytidyl-2-C-methyl-D-erythritol kinase